MDKHRVGDHALDLAFLVFVVPTREAHVVSIPWKKFLGAPDRLN